MASIQLENPDALVAFANTLGVKLPELSENVNQIFNQCIEVLEKTGSNKIETEKANIEEAKQEFIKMIEVLEELKKSQDERIKELQRLGICEN